MDFEFLPIPEEMKQHLQQQADQQEMAVDSYRHDVQRMFEELKREHLISLRHVLHNLGAGPYPSPLAAYYEGVVASELSHRFNICPGCGINHDEQLVEALAEDKGDPEQEGPVTIQTLAEFVDGKPGRILDPPLTSTELENMREYRLDDLRSDETGELLGFICTDCGMKYQSIEDRMVKAPDECNGCFEKSRWG